MRVPDGNLRGYTVSNKYLLEGYTVTFHRAAFWLCSYMQLP